MNRRQWFSRFLTGLCLIWIGLAGSASTSSAQGLLWNAPEVGSFVRYAGPYRQTTLRPESTEGDLTLEWQRTVEIRCVEAEMADWNGETVPCLWIELETQTGQQVDGVLETGPGAARIYKLLVPEAAILGEEFLELPVPRAYLPIVKGFRQIGTGAVEPLTTGFQAFPLITQLYIDEQATLKEQSDVSVVPGTFASKHFSNQVTIESATSRTVNSSELWISGDVPFGPVKWTVRSERFQKTLVDTRDQFEKRSELTIQLELTEIGNAAVAKIPNK